MPNPPFKPPETRPSGKPPKLGSPLRAVLTGLVVDLGGSLVIDLVLSLGYRASLALSGLSADEIASVLKDPPPGSVFVILSMLMGACCSVAGGYVCARIVRRDEFRIGAIMASLSAFLSLAMVSDDADPDMLVLGTLSTVACVLLGVKYGREHNLRQATQPASPPAAGSDRP